MPHAGTAAIALTDKFVFRARALFYARLTLDGLGLLVLMVPPWTRMLGIHLPEALYFYLLLLGGHITAFVWVGRKGDKVAVFVSLCVDLLALIYLVALTGGLGSPVMQGQVVYTVFFATLYPSPLAILPPLLTLPVVAKLQQVLGMEVATSDILLLLWTMAITSMVVLVVVYLDRRQEAYLAEVVRLQRQRRLSELASERARIARDMHDGLGAMISSVVIQAEYIDTQLTEEHPLRSEVSELRQTAQEGMEELRRVVSMMREDFDLVATLEDYVTSWAQRQHLSASVDVKGLERKLNPDANLCTFRVLQEALSNVARHSGAKEVGVELSFEPDRFQLAVTDDGKGFDSSEKQKGHFGLENMALRAAQCNGKTWVDASPSKGTKVMLSLPLEAQE